MAGKPEATAADIYKFLFGAANEALKYRKLTGGDRRGVQQGMSRLAWGLERLSIGKPEERERAARNLMAGAYMIGSHAHASDSALIFGDQKHGNRTKKTERQISVELWGNWVKDRVNEALVGGKKVKATILTAAIVKRPDRPRNLPADERVLKFVRKTLRAMNKKPERLRLVKG